jgi:hypothetical protein
MTKGIVIGTSEASKDFLRPLLESIKETEYNILIVSNGDYTPDLSYFDRQYDLVVNKFNGWELAVIEQGKKHFDEFVHIHDTTLIKDISMFGKLFAIEGHVVLTKGNYHYMGKFVSNNLPNLPRVHDKVMAIMLEVRWLDDYPYTEFEPDLPVHTLVYEEIHGKRRMVLENIYMKKWKGTAWVTPEQMAELTEAILNKAKI